MSRRQFLAASITASLAAIALTKAARAGHVPAQRTAASTRDQAPAPSHPGLTPAPVDKRDCHHRVIGSG